MSSALGETQKFLVPFLETQKLLIRWTIGCQLLIYPMTHAAGVGNFFHLLRFQNRSFLEVLDSVLNTSKN